MQKIVLFIMSTAEITTARGRLDYSVTAKITNNYAKKNMSDVSRLEFLEIRCNLTHDNIIKGCRKCTAILDRKCSVHIQKNL